MRARITERFAELHHQREQAQAQLDALQETTPKAADPTLLDELPLAGDIRPGLDPGLKARLFHAFDLQVLWNKPGRQATVFAEITEATLRALPGLLNPGQDGYDDTADTAPDEDTDVEDLFESPITGPMFIGPVEPDPELLIPAACGAGETSVARPCSRSAPSEPQPSSRRAACSISGSDTRTCAAASPSGMKLSAEVTLAIRPW